MEQVHLHLRRDEDCHYLFATQVPWCWIRNGVQIFNFGVTRDGAQKWAGFDWELSREGEELSSEHLHYNSTALGGFSFVGHIDHPKREMETPAVVATVST
ncbi:hypothetical protein BTVI_87784 [Pitangus sulphuratus]|nr:hypothetical protein BTVI_87784 [Pitangus sulphuratus]